MRQTENDIEKKEGKERKKERKKECIYGDACIETNDERTNLRWKASNSWDIKES